MLLAAAANQHQDCVEVLTSTANRLAENASIVGAKEDVEKIDGGSYFDQSSDGDGRVSFLLNFHTIF